MSMFMLVIYYLSTINYRNFIIITPVAVILAAIGLNQILMFGKHYLRDIKFIAATYVVVMVHPFAFYNTIYLYKMHEAEPTVLVHIQKKFLIPLSRNLIIPRKT